jgi:hypothetical protein
MSAIETRSALQSTNVTINVPRTIIPHPNIIIFFLLKISDKCPPGIENRVYRPK